MKVVTFDPDSCVGCRNCEYACAYEQKGDFHRADSNIKVNVYSVERVCLPWTCVHCSQAWCMEVCPAGAITRNSGTGAVVIDPKQCAGCKLCIMACPFGSIHFDVTEQVSKKCDLCGGDPNCVKYCISGALQYVDVENAFQIKRQKLDLRIIEVLGLVK